MGAAGAPAWPGAPKPHQSRSMHCVPKPLEEAARVRGGAALGIDVMYVANVKGSLPAIEDLELQIFVEELFTDVGSWRRRAASAAKVRPPLPAASLASFRNVARADSPQPPEDPITGPADCAKRLDILSPRTFKNEHFRSLDFLKSIF